jgi:MGT family glycosyltransferase
MSKILVASTPLLGHVSPMLLVAASLKRQGHEVRFLTGEVFRERVQDQGIAFTSLHGYANYDWRNLSSLFTPEEGAATGFEGHIIHLKRMFADCIPDQYHALEDALRLERPEQSVDLIIIDVLYMGILPLLLRNGKRPPVISCGVIAPMWRDAGFSSFNGADNSPEGQIRNIEDGRRFDAAVLPGTSYIDQLLARLGVAVEGGFRMFDTMYRLPDRMLQFGTKDFEYPLVEGRENLRFIGPILPVTNDDLHAPAWLQEMNTSKPVVFVTQGTLANTNFEQLINPTIAAFADEPVTVVATAGSGDRSLIKRAPNAVVEPYVPYELVLPKTTVFVTNGGYNGVQHALSFGVPVISAGATEDKPYVSARVAWSGAGIDLKTGNPSPEQIREAAQQIIVRPEFRDRAQALSKSIRRTDALASIRTEVEELLEKKAGVMSRFSHA